MKEAEDISGYGYTNSQCSHAHGYLLPAVRAELQRERARLGDRPARLFDLGCGNGSVAATLAGDGWDVTGVDPSSEGIAAAKDAFPELRLAQGSSYDNLRATYGCFPVVISLEVVEHVYAPRDYARTLFDLVEPGGGDHLDALPWLSEESCTRGDGTDGRPLHGALGSWAYQVLVHSDAHATDH